MATLDQLIVEFGADFKEMDRAFRRAERESQQSMGRISSALKAGERQMFGLIAGAGAALAGYFSVDFVKGALDAVGGLGELAEQLGITAEQLQVLQYAAIESGVSTQELEAGLARFTRTLGDAAGGNDAALKTFRDLGIGILDAGGRSRDATAVFADAAEALSQVEDPARRAALAAELFGRGGQRLLPILSQGKAGLEGFARAAHDAGVVMSAELIAKADQASDAWAKFSFAARAQINALVVQAIPSFETLGKAATWLVDTLKRGLIDDASTGQELTASYERLVRLREDLAKVEQQLGNVGSAEPARIAALRTEIELEGNRHAMLMERLRLESQQQGAPAFKPASTGGGGTSNPTGEAEAKKVEALTQALEKQVLALRQQVDAYGMTELAAARLRREREAMLALGVAEAAQLPEEIQFRLGNIAALEREIETRTRLADQSRAAQQEAVAYEGAAADVVRRRQEATAALRFDMAEEVRLLEAQVEAAKGNAVAWNELTQAYEVHDRQLRVVMKTQELLRANTNLTAEEAEALAGRWVDANDKLRQANDASRKEADRLNNIGRDLGLTFTSAFEDAAVGGKKLREVILGLAQDLARLALRKTVTEPMLELFSGLFGGSGGGGKSGGGLGGLLSGLFGGGGGGGGGAHQMWIDAGAPLSFFATGTPSAPPGWAMVGEEGPELVHFRGGERVFNARDTARMGSGDTYMIDARGADESGIARLEAYIRSVNGSIERRAVAAVSDAKMRGGGVRAALA